MKVLNKRNVPIYIIVIAVVGLCMVSVYRVFYIASHEQFKVISVATSQPTTPTQISWVPYSNSYFSLTYPDSAREQILEKNANPAVLASWVVHQSNPYMQFASQVLREPAMTSIADFPGVAFRHMQTDIYTQAPITIDSTSGVQFSRHADAENPAEFGAFFFANHTVYTFVVQAKDEQFAENIFRHIMSTISLADDFK